MLLIGAKQSVDTLAWFFYCSIIIKASKINTMYALGAAVSAASRPKSYRMIIASEVTERGTGEHVKNCHA